MQDFEINGRAMQLGWGQENSDQQPSNNECFRETKISQKQNAKVRILHLDRCTLTEMCANQKDNNNYYSFKSFTCSFRQRISENLTSKV